MLFVTMSGAGFAHADNEQVSATLDNEAANGKRLFDTHCLACHTGALPEAPQLAALQIYSPERIVTALNSGVMSTQALMLSSREQHEVAYYLTGKKVAEKKSAEPEFLCSDPTQPAGKSSDPAGDLLWGWTGWGGTAGNQRFQSQETTITAATAPDLKLKWAFGFADTTRVRAQPTVHAGRVYIGSQAGTVYALDSESGCVHWQFQAAAEVRGAVKLLSHAASDKQVILFGDFKANAYALDAESGELLWQQKVHDHPLATITGSVAADQDHVYVPVSSSEVVPAAQEGYECCSFRGAVVAVNISTGDIAWRYYTTPAPQPTGKSSVGTNQFGPSGAPVWSSPTVDGKRDVVYITTGQNYSSPATGTSDAVIALGRKDGKPGWISQVWANDAWNGACSRKTANCPKEDGPDFDIGASAMLSKTSDGKELLLVGQKSGLVYAMDPDAQGKIIWQQRVGSGGTMGGVHWGMSTDGERLYVGISDLPTRNPYAEGDPQPGLHALDPRNGEIIWRKLIENSCPKGLKFLCFPGISAAVSSSPGVVFAGGLDGMLRAFDATDGKVLWEHLTRRDYETVNGIAGNGGAIEAAGPVIADGQLYVTSGYDKWGELPGNVLLVFAPEESTENTEETQSSAATE